MQSGFLLKVTSRFTSFPSWPTLGRRWPIPALGKWRWRALIKSGPEVGKLVLQSQTVYAFAALGHRFSSHCWILLLWLPPICRQCVNEQTDGPDLAWRLEFAEHRSPPQTGSVKTLTLDTSRYNFLDSYTGQFTEILLVSKTFQPISRVSKAPAYLACK